MSEFRPLFWTLLLACMDYRVELPVRSIMVFSSSKGESGYYICPRCQITLDREFTAYCDRCGQRLGWRGYKNAKVIYPGRRGHS